jgi:hypothetical protein
MPSRTSAVGRREDLPREAQRDRKTPENTEFTSSRLDREVTMGGANVQSSLVIYMRDQINEQLPPGLQARVEESLLVDTEQYARTIYPDVRVVEHPDELAVPELTRADVAVAEPHVIALLDEVPKQRHIEIVDRDSGNQVVTVIELLSPANKRSEAGRRAYLEKQREYLQGGVNLVEIDLIREGEFVVAIPETLVPPDCRTPYIICIRRVLRPRRVELIPVPLSQPLPNIRIPLRRGDPDVVLQLQQLLDDCYRRGRYASLDYNRPLNPPLREDEKRWVEQLLKQREGTA